MSRRNRSKEQDDEMELNMTPMLDVVFILLIFFIVTSVFVKTPGVDVFKPTATVIEEWQPGILAAVTGENEVWVDKTPYRINEVRPVMQAMRDENPKATGIIIADGAADVGTVMQLQEMMVELGIETRVSTEE